MSTADFDFFPPSRLRRPLFTFQVKHRYMTMLNKHSISSYVIEHLLSLVALTNDDAV